MWEQGAHLLVCLSSCFRVPVQPTIPQAVQAALRARTNCGRVSREYQESSGAGPGLESVSQSEPSRVIQGRIWLSDGLQPCLLRLAS